MDKHLMELMDTKMKVCKKALEANGMKAFVVDNAKEACAIVNQMIQDGEQVCDGGTMTLQETGILESLQKRAINFHTHADTTMSREESDAEARKAFSADTFIASSNAVTLKGELINVDGHGNRVSAMIFGPKQVIIVVGYNKIVPDEAAAIERIHTIAAPANCVRLDKQTPCRILGECKNCAHKDRICSSYVKLNYDKEDRIRVILVKEHLGY